MGLYFFSVLVLVYDGIVGIDYLSLCPISVQQPGQPSVHELCNIHAIY